MTTTGPFYSGWYPVEICVKCSFAIDRETSYHNGGICPYCGHDSDSTICATVNRIQRDVYYKDWHFFGLIPVKRIIKHQVK